MTVQLGAFLRTTLPLGLDSLADYDSGRYHSLWLPDHMVSFWPDSIWTPEFTDLAVASPSPHRHLDALAVAGAVAVLTERTPISTLVVDTVRRHPAMLAQTALTLSHLSKGRFILGLGSGELENVVPYGFDFRKPVSRLEEAIKVIKLLWESEGTVDFAGEFFTLEHARLDTEAYQGKFPPIYMAAGGPRMLDILGRYGDGWFPGAIRSPEHYAEHLGLIQRSAEKAGRDPQAITPIFMCPCFIGDDDELDELLAAPLIKAYVLQINAENLRSVGYDHPMGPDWQGIHSLDPAKLTREVLLDVFERTTPEMLKAWVPHGPPEKVARYYKQYADAGAKVIKMLDYGGMAGMKFAARSAQRSREAEDALLKMCNG
ncbi:MAG: LLM class flavin-dependent oxidoreductase [Sphingomonadales bacterium]|nr:LLM class flavin-dependent oxidoreductase [Sphingomonadales bacterium]